MPAASCAQLARTQLPSKTAFLRTGLLWWCVFAAYVCGCGDGGPKRYAVSGEVKWNGKPLDGGAITFLPENASLASGGGAAIKNGQYAIPAEKGLLPGRYKVMITAADPQNFQADPDAPPGPAGPLPKDRINPRYNVQTILTADVQAGGPNKFNFQVD